MMERLVNLSAREFFLATGIALSLFGYGLYGMGGTLGEAHQAPLAMQVIDFGFVVFPDFYSTIGAITAADPPAAVA